MGVHACSPTATRSPFSDSAFGRCEMGLRPRTRFAGRSSSATATWTRRSSTATRRASAAGSASGVPREDVFITRKFLPGRRDAEAEAGRSLRRLGVDQVDLYIVHWPQAGPTRAWPGMERAHERGYARSIGVSNYGVSELDELMSVAEIPPVVNQVQFSPFEYRRKLLKACEERNVTLEAYSPLGTGRHLSDERVSQIAERVGRTPAQVLLRWSVQRDLVVIPKSTHRDRIEGNAQIFDFTLSDEDMAALDALDRTGGTERG